MGQVWSKVLGRCCQHTHAFKGYSCKNHLQLLLLYSLQRSQWLKYGFTPKSYIPREQLTAFESFKAENQKFIVPGGYVEKPIVIKDDDDNDIEEDSISPTATAAGAAAGDEDDEEMDDGFKIWKNY